MIVTNFITIPSSSKKIIFNDSSFLDGEDHDFYKMTPTNATLKITVKNSKTVTVLNQSNELRNEVVLELD